MKYNINLLSKKKEKFLEKIIHFSLNYLRYILVITQTIVIGVFFYKFKVDQEIIDLKEEGDQKKEIIEVTQPLFNQAQQFEFKLSQLKEIYQQQSSLVGLIDYLLSRFPKDLFLTKLQLSEKSTLLEGFSQDAKLIQMFYNRLRKEKRFSNINLGSIKRSEMGFVFNLRLDQFIF